MGAALGMLAATNDPAPPMSLDHFDEAVRQILAVFGLGADSSSLLAEFQVRSCLEDLLREHELSLQRRAVHESASRESHNQRLQELRQRRQDVDRLGAAAILEKNIVCKEQATASAFAKEFVFASVPTPTRSMTPARTSELRKTAEWESSRHRREADAPRMRVAGRPGFSRSQVEGSLTTFGTRSAIVSFGPDPRDSPKKPRNSPTKSRNSPMISHNSPWTPEPILTARHAASATIEGQW